LGTNDRLDVEAQVADLTAYDAVFGAGEVSEGTCVRSDCQPGFGANQLAGGGNLHVRSRPIAESAFVCLWSDGRGRVTTIEFANH
jgi:hypothetical protein